VAFLAEGAFNKLYTITQTSKADGDQPNAYIFRVSLPVEPFYKTASEVATLSFLRRQTSVPVPKVIAHCSTVENELRFEWILMEKIPGVSLRSLWSDMSLEAKTKIVRQVGWYVGELREKCLFDAIGSLYHRAELGEKEDVVATSYNEFVVGPIVTTFFFVGGRRMRVERNRGPYRNDHDYMLALTQVELEDMKLLQMAPAGM
jgi:hypothetical protein